MSIVLRMQNLRFAHPGQADDLIAGASWELSQGQKVGLLGLNGAGKSTLLHLVGGSLEPDSGLIERRYGSLFVLGQEDRAEGHLSARQYLLSADAALLESHQRLAAMERENLPEPLAYADLSQRFLEAGGFERLAQIERVALKFGFAPEVLNRPVMRFSGGERRLLRLASAFVQNYDLYLLDEPTNYLDDSASDRLLRALQASKETLLTVSHDRWFLDGVADHILELERGKLRLFSGNYTAFAETKAREYAEAVRKKEKLEREIGKLKEVERSYKTWGGRKEAEKAPHTDKGFIGAKAAKLQARAVQAKERMGERIEELEETKPWVEKFYEVRFAEVEKRQGRVLDVQKLGFAWGEGDLFKDLSFRLEWGEKVHLTGENGSGKSTLIHLLLGKLPLQRGEIRWGSRIRWGYLPQQGSGLDERLEVHQLFSKEQQQDARTTLGAFKVAGDTFFQPLGSLSEGQQRKVALVKLILERPNFLVLDEPTTHLDYGSVEMLESMLRGFGGAVLFASHDRYFSGRVAGRRLELGPYGTLEPSPIPSPSHRD